MAEDSEEEIKKCTNFIVLHFHNYISKKRIQIPYSDVNLIERKCAQLLNFLLKVNQNKKKTINLGLKNIYYDFDIYLVYIVPNFQNGAF